MWCEVFFSIKYHSKGNLMRWFELLGFPIKSMAKVISCSVKCLHILCVQHHVTRPFPHCLFFSESSKHSPLSILLKSGEPQNCTSQGKTQAIAAVVASAARCHVYKTAVKCVNIIFHEH